MEPNDGEKIGDQPNNGDSNDIEQNDGEQLGWGLLEWLFSYEESPNGTENAKAIIVSKGTQQNHSDDGISDFSGGSYGYTNNYDWTIILICGA